MQTPIFRIFVPQMQSPAKYRPGRPPSLASRPLPLPAATALEKNWSTFDEIVEKIKAVCFSGKRRSSEFGDDDTG